MTETIYEKKKSGFGKVIFWVVFVLLVVFGGWFYYKYYFVFGEGVKSGTLNYVVRKGNIFKTYEGKIIQDGFGRAKTGSGISSYEFEFSVEDEAVFKQLETNSGKYFDLHYKEYHGVLPWRGNTVYIVDKVVNMK
ncbi:TPA: hypothetical protein JRW62_001625 [Elizabethkingia meningoseptica]|uniref:hypothetical protein n=1 Tax=Elizabethkingia meningoseptica TaxID=238 RepID=UPI000998EA8D|nr:hypothetical protein [Elizabethkingia meningoseptica]EJK5328947.1 hypothetical protein [Elizabethkingia meningoseptica]MEC4713190.1 hypothetical protein [Elizabethkingia meningoseptica]OPB95339.1 hypothetical protein BAS10_10750 [Elizabethkingia meningoseptica]WBS75124.1 hypothetical protein PF438_01260 [Elizabethkingia meningoseptica]HAY3562629.1 hypothetical protein [Elizabethkingia meningoseptica]